MTDPDDVWLYINVFHEHQPCPNCGQKLSFKYPCCLMCHEHMHGAVLAICRLLLNKSLRDFKANQLSEKEEGDLREIALSKILAEFPFELARRTTKFRRSLETEGVWFAHLNAYCMVRDLRPSDWSPYDVVLDKLYVMMRNEWFDFLGKGERFLDANQREALESIYTNPTASLDGHRVILNMIMELEKEDVLTIIRPKAHCGSCGKEIPSGQALCRECEDAAVLENRQKIVSGLSSPAPHPAPEPSSDSSEGMHFKR